MKEGTVTITTEEYLNLKELEKACDAQEPFRVIIEWHNYQECLGENYYNVSYEKIDKTLAESNINLEKSISKLSDSNCKLRREIIELQDMSWREFKEYKKMKKNEKK
jgi:chaperonin cofactor prefoldin